MGKKGKENISKKNQNVDEALSSIEKKAVKDTVEESKKKEDSEIVLDSIAIEPKKDSRAPTEALPVVHKKEDHKSHPVPSTDEKGHSNHPETLTTEIEIEVHHESLNTEIIFEKDSQPLSSEVVESNSEHLPEEKEFHHSEAPDTLEEKKAEDSGVSKPSEKSEPLHTELEAKHTEALHSGLDAKHTESLHTELDAKNSEPLHSELEAKHTEPLHSEPEAKDSEASITKVTEDHSEGSEAQPLEEKKSEEPSASKPLENTPEVVPADSHSKTEISEHPEEKPLEVKPPENKIFSHFIKSTIAAHEKHEENEENNLEVEIKEKIEDSAQVEFKETEKNTVEVEIQEKDEKEAEFDLEIKEKSDLEVYETVKTDLEETKKCEFSVEYTTVFGEKIVIVGSSEEIGNWDPKRGFELTWESETLWKGVLTYKTLPFEYKYVKVIEDNYTWENGFNRGFSGGTESVKDTWQYF